MNSEIKKINIENTDDQSNIVSKSHKAFEIIDQETDEECVRLQINNNRSSQRTAYQNQDKPAVSSNPFIYDDLEEWVESEGGAKSIDQINFTTPCKSEIVQGNKNANYELEFRNPYIVYRFKNVITVFRIYFYIYVLIQLAVAWYIGSALGGSFGYPVEFWILTITVIKIMIDASILAHFLGQHQDRLIAPAIISTGVFSFLALLVFITPKITRFFLY
jgi:hypothetical protein